MVFQADNQLGGWYRAEFLGFIEGQNGHLTRFDIVFKGTAEAAESDYKGGTYPPSEYTLAIAVTLCADPNELFARVPLGAARFDGSSRWRRGDHLPGLRRGRRNRGEAGPGLSGPARACDSPAQDTSDPVKDHS